MTKHVCALVTLLAAAPAAAEPVSFFIQTGAYATDALAEKHCAPLAQLGFPLAVTPDETPGGRRLWFCRSADPYSRAAAEEILAAVREQDGHDDAILVRDERRLPLTLREAFAKFLEGEAGAVPPALRAEFEAFMREQAAEPPASAKTPEPPKTDGVIAFDFRA